MKDFDAAHDITLFVESWIASIFQKPAVTRTSFGSPSVTGIDCNAGVDIVTRSPGTQRVVSEHTIFALILDPAPFAGDVVAAIAGEVIAIRHNYTACVDGWGVKEEELSANVMASAGTVAYPPLPMNVS